MTKTNSMTLWGDPSSSAAEVSTLRRFVTSPKFEAAIAVMIALNTLIIALDAQYGGIDKGHQMGYPKYNQSAANALPGLDVVFEVFDYFFGVIFTIEMILKMTALNWRWFFSSWNWFDAFIVVFWLIEKSDGGGGMLPFPPMILRIARLARVFRLLRLIRTIQGFDSLFLMTTAFKASIKILFWSAMLLFVFQLMIGLTLHHSLVDFMSSPDEDIEARFVIFEYFGTCSRATLTMFEITLGNWPPVARILQENVDEGYVAFSLCHKLTIGFAVIGVINGVFMQETFNVAASDDQLMMRQRERAVKLHVKKMEALFKVADESGDGYLDYEEFMHIVTNPHVKSWLAAQQLDVSDAELMFVLMYDGDGQITAKELVRAASKLKGPARSIDLHNLMREQDILKKMINDVSNVVSNAIQQPMGCKVPP